MNKKLHKAFTLAEVLITLGIIGIVANLTIPRLLEENQKRIYIVQLKKEYSQLTEALQMMTVEAGCPNDLNCTPFVNPTVPANRSKEIAAALKKQLNIVDDCGINSTKKCATDKANFCYDGSCYMYGVPSYENLNTYGGGYSLVTASGANVIFKDYGDCESNLSGEPVGAMQKICGWVFIDVNGTKKPNYAGRDIYMFFISNSKGPNLRASGDSKTASETNSWLSATGTPRACDKGNRYGIMCAGRVIEQGWEMNY